MKISFDASTTTKPSAIVTHQGNGIMNPESAFEMGGKLFNALKSKGTKDAVIEIKGFDAAAAAYIADGFLRASYTFNKYKTTAQNEGPQTVSFVADKPQEAEAAFAPLRATTESVFWASDLVNEPANVLNPATYAARVAKELLPLGIKVRLLQDFEMRMRGMGAALAVGQGSKTPPCMLVLEYDGSNGAKKQPLALVGKGITFDSGGISIKPSSGMGNMTMDMAGSAAVAGAIRALALQGSKSHVVGVMALAENMPGPNSMRPGDIVKSMSGKSIYIGNTDAEGRLVLCDAITYVQQKYNPHTVIDIATLTGAAAAALGNEFTAAFTNNDQLFAKFNKAANKTGERIWRMPLDESAVAKAAVKDAGNADLTNNATGPGALTAAAFLHEFIEKDENGKDKRKFLHLDIAGPGMPKTTLKGYGVDTFVQFVLAEEQKAVAANQNTPKSAPVRKQPKL